MKVLSAIKNRRLQPDRYTFTTLLVACGRDLTVQDCCEQVSYAVLSRVMGVKVAACNTNIAN